jgi:indole-3-glycerol phosphate synthase
VSGPTPTVLAGILQSTRAELERRKRELPPAVLERRAELLVDEATPTSSPRGFRDALTQPGRIAVIAEFKRRSPSAGSLREQPDLAEMLAAYRRGGARALSVLTEEPNFGGSLDDLRAARELCELPAIRKDFILERYQLLEARLAGADAVLLIVAALGDPELAALHDEARALGLDVLVEIHDRAELQRALEVGPELIGINNRDLRDFSVDLERTRLLRGSIPAGVAVVSESGISTAEQLRGLEQDGVDAVLVGGSLMRAPDPERALRSLLGGKLEGQGREHEAREAHRRDSGDESETARLPGGP